MSNETLIAKISVMGHTLGKSGFVLIPKSFDLVDRVFANGVQSQVGSYQRLEKWYLIPTCLALSIIRHVSRIKWSNPGKVVAPSPTPRCSSYWKGSLPVARDYGRQLYFTRPYKIMEEECDQCSLVVTVTSQAIVRIGSKEIPHASNWSVLSPSEIHYFFLLTTFLEWLMIRRIQDLEEFQQASLIKKRNH